MKARGGCRCRVYIDTTTVLGRGRLASPTSAAFIPGKAHGADFIRLSVHQDQSGHEGAKKNLHPSDKFQSKPTHIISHDQILN